jgi:hypothetical protein
MSIPHSEDEAIMLEEIESANSKKEMLAELKAAYDEATRWVGCGDNSCMFVKPTGMATNGGCRCLGRDGCAPGIPRSLAKLYKAAKKLIEDNK